MSKILKKKVSEGGIMVLEALSDILLIGLGALSGSAASIIFGLTGGIIGAIIGGTLLAIFKRIYRNNRCEGKS